MECKHFNGLQHDKCEAGIVYDTRRDSEQVGRDQLPCCGVGQCPHYDPPTREEIEAEEAEFKKRLDNFKSFLRREHSQCPQCGKSVKRLDQVRRSTYARPCGCRISQGLVPEAWRK